jgi:hypothetical protein
LEAHVFVGHYAASFAAKSAEPRAPLWSYVLGSQLIDVGWSIFVLAGIEKVRINPVLQGSVLDLYQMPYTHSLPGALLWAVLAAAILRLALRLPNRAAIAFGVVVFSHWLLDLIVHRPDLQLWFSGPKVGFGLWNSPVLEMAVEIGFLAVAGGLWISSRRSAGLRGWPALGLLSLFVVMQVGFLAGPLPSGSMQIAVFALAMYALATVAAWLVDRHDAKHSLHLG